MPRSRSRSYSRSRSASAGARSKTPSYSRSRSRSRSRHSRGSRSVSPLSNRKRHVGDRDLPPPSKVIGVFGLNLTTTDRELRKVFEKFGRLDDAMIIHDRKTGMSRGFGFVYFSHVEDAETAKEETNGLEIDGKKIRVDFSVTKRPHTPTPGQYMGRPTMNRYSRGYSGRGDGGGGSSRYGGGRRRSYSRSRSRSPRERYSSSRRYNRSRTRSYSRSPSRDRSRSRSPRYRSRR